MVNTRISLVTLGGTIATTKASAPFPSIGGTELLARAGLTGYATRVIDLKCQRGSRLTLKDAEDTIHTIRSLTTDPNVEGIVVTTGTATLEELAYLLAIAVPPLKSVTVTGSMRSVDDENGWDGKRNIRDAFAVAAARDSSVRNTLIVFDGEIHSPWVARKTVVNGTVRYVSLPLAPLGSVKDEQIRIDYDLPSIIVPNVRAPLSRRVIVWTAVLGGEDPASFLLQFLDGVVLEGFPGPDFILPEPVAQFVRELLDRGLLVGYVSRGDGAAVKNALSAEPRLLASRYLTAPKLRMVLAATLPVKETVTRVREGLASMDEECAKHAVV